MKNSSKATTQSVGFRRVGWDCHRPPAYGIESLDRALAKAAPESGASIQMKAAPSAAGGDPGSTPPNRTGGMSDALKTGVESLFGLALDDVRVHYKSFKPAELQALAYTQGTDIHVVLGQKRHRSTSSPFPYFRRECASVGNRYKDCPAKRSKP